MWVICIPFYTTTAITVCIIVIISLPPFITDKTSLHELVSRVEKAVEDERALSVGRESNLLRRGKRGQCLSAQDTLSNAKASLLAIETKVAGAMRGRLARPITVTGTGECP